MHHRAKQVFVGMMKLFGIEWPIDVKDIVISDKDLNRAVDWKDADLF